MKLLEASIVFVHFMIHDDNKNSLDNHNNKTLAMSLLYTMNTYYQ